MPVELLGAVRWLVTGLALVLAVQGLSWMVMGSFEPSGWYDGLLAQSQTGQPTLTSEARAVFRFALVPFGATDAAYFALVAVIAWFGIEQRWALWGVVGSFGLWWVADTVGCAALGAWFNIVVVNVPCLVLVAPALGLWAAALHGMIGERSSTS